MVGPAPITPWLRQPLKSMDQGEPRGNQSGHCHQQHHYIKSFRQLFTWPSEQLLAGVAAWFRRASTGHVLAVPVFHPNMAHPPPRQSQNSAELEPEQLGCGCC